LDSLEFAVLWNDVMNNPAKLTAENVEPFLMKQFRTTNKQSIKKILNAKYPGPKEVKADCEAH